MSETHSTYLAFQTLTLVSLVLNCLEVGDVAIARFGDSVDVVHDFDSAPFNGQSRAAMLKQFHFNQDTTNVVKLLESSLNLLSDACRRRAAASQTAGELWQLQIIVSDGICQSHDRLRPLLRQAEEQRVMIIFIILTHCPQLYMVRASQLFQ
jgi:midasin